MLSYERQRLRELEALRPDFAHADKKYIPASVPSRPAYVPKLEDDVKAAPPRVGTPQKQFASPIITPRTFQPSLPSTIAPIPPSKNQLPPQSPGAGPSLPSSPISTKPTSPAPSFSSRPLLGGGTRMFDGTRSMFLTPSATLAASNSVRSPTSNTDPLSGRLFTPVSAANPASSLLSSTPTGSPHSPLTAPATTISSPLPSSTLGSSTAPPPTSKIPPSSNGLIHHETDPLGPLGDNPNARRAAAMSSSLFTSPLGPGPRMNGSATPPPADKNGDLDPFGLARPASMSQSMRLPSKPQRPRLDAREAAKTLANF